MSKFKEFGDGLTTETDRVGLGQKINLPSCDLEIGEKNNHAHRQIVTSRLNKHAASNYIREWHTTRVHL